MRKNVLKVATIATGIVSVSFLSSCHNRDNMMSDDAKSKMERTITFENIITPKEFSQSGTFKGIKPGESVSITFSAGKTQRLMFTTMFANSYDWFFASKQPGIKLFDDNGNAITGDVSSQLTVWDNGTKDEITGTPEDKVIETRGNVLKVRELMKDELSYNESTSVFTLKITNTSEGKLAGANLRDKTQNLTPFSDGVWVVSNYDGQKLLSEKPFFTVKEKTNPEITDVAQMGDITKLYNKVKANTGIITGLSPALVVVYTGEKNPLYELNKKDQGLGLKELSQKGDFSKLQESLKKDKSIKEVYIAGNTPVAPGQKMMATYKVETGAKVAYATMFGFSNDWFYTNEQNISAEHKGDVTNRTSLFDSGTGVDQFPGAGNRQALFGGTPEKENNPIQKVGNKFPVPAVANTLKITIN